MRSSSWTPDQPGCATPTRFAGLIRGVALRATRGPNWTPIRGPVPMPFDNLIAAAAMAGLTESLLRFIL
ncbi:hypothetical protein, partial [Lactiplantibacillus plantarum]|uniref:hypothetical protein n=1 Tax=Lactiplantibacillus plantarum TaxID=1590 RepID=UPI001C9E965A